MPVDPTLVGHETATEVGAITAEDVRQFADAIGDGNPIFRDPAAAARAGYTGIAVPPTFITRFRVPFAEAGLDPEHSQVLHGEQEYTYMRPLVVGETLSSRHRVASLRQSARVGGMAIMTLEHLVDSVTGERIATGKSIVIVRDTPPDGEAASASGSGGKSQPAPEGIAIPAVVKRITQQQINAYADASGDHNPIHIDPAAARAVGLDGTIAHGMLSMAFLGQVVTDWLTAQPTPGGWLARLRVRFQAMARPGDTLSCQGVLGERKDGRQRLDLWIDNQQGERLTTGDADAAIGAAS
ncbi:MAG TPA: MaoC family dehydratase N-terminal domain-containing protein [Ktedonobacterales bacterium]|nr:MaoC family dehydratase N-terminal domain-containing protein [Ktedonobacterales bacterium]